MRNPIKIHFQLINLPQNIMKSRYLCIRKLNRISSPIILLRRHDL